MTLLVVKHVYKWYATRAVSIVQLLYTVRSERLGASASNAGHFTLECMLNCSAATRCTSSSA